MSAAGGADVMRIEDVNAAALTRPGQCLMNLAPCVSESGNSQSPRLFQTFYTAKNDHFKSISPSGQTLRGKPTMSMKMCMCNVLSGHVR